MHRIEGRTDPGEQRSSDVQVVAGTRGWCTSSDPALAQNAIPSWYIRLPPLGSKARRDGRPGRPHSGLGAQAPSTLTSTRPSRLIARTGATHRLRGAATAVTAAAEPPAVVAACWGRAPWRVGCRVQEGTLRRAPRCSARWTVSLEIWAPGRAPPTTASRALPPGSQAPPSNWGARGRTSLPPAPEEAVRRGSAQCAHLPPAALCCKQGCGAAAGPTPHPGSNSSQQATQNEKTHPFSPSRPAPQGRAPTTSAIL